MSDFERWFEKEFANVDPTEYRGNTFQLGKSNMEYGWNAAKQSMQGEAVGAVVNAGCIYLGTLKPGLKDGTPLYTHAPDSAARIAELEAQSDEDTAVIDKLSRLLAAIAITLKGIEPDLTKWSYHDLPELALYNVNKISELEAENEALRKDAKRLHIVLAGHGAHGFAVSQKVSGNYGILSGNEAVQAIDASLNMKGGAE